MGGRCLFTFVLEGIVPTASLQNMPLTINILRPIQIYTQYAPVREGNDEDIISHLRGHEVGGNGELELDSLDVEDGESSVCVVQAARRAVDGREAV